MEKAYKDFDLGPRLRFRALARASMSEFIDTLEANKSLNEHRTETWAGATFEDAASQARDGDLSYVERSNALLEKVEGFDGLQGLRPVTQKTVAGGAVNIPAMLAGKPRHMIAKRKQVKAGGEIVVMVNAFISASIDHDAILRRGVAQLALVRSLAQVRPVRLIIYGGHSASGTPDKKPHFFAYPIETAPMDLARAAWAMCAPQSYRQIMLAAEDLCGGATTFALEGEAIPKAWAQSVTGAEGVLVTPPLVSKDGTVPFQTDKAAAAWVQDRMREALA